MYNKKDYFHKKAKEDGYFARSAYKLKEIQKKYNILRPAFHVLDLGCAPGAWSQVVLEYIAQGSLLGIDLEPVSWKHKRAKFLQGDIFSLEASLVSEFLFDCILSDMAPKTTGIALQDKARSMELGFCVLEWTKVLLKKDASLVLKVFEGEDFPLLFSSLKKIFQRLERFRPKSTRRASKELYIIGLKKY